MFLHDINAVKTALSNSAAFRTWTGTATPVLAAAKVFRFTGDVDNAPMAVLSLGDWARERGDLGADFYTKPAVIVEFIETCYKDASTESVLVNLLEDVSGIVDDLESQTTYLITDITILSDTPERTKHSAVTDYVSFRIAIFGDEWQAYAT